MFNKPWEGEVAVTTSGKKRISYSIQAVVELEYNYRIIIVKYLVIQYNETIQIERKTDTGVLGKRVEAKHESMIQ